MPKPPYIGHAHSVRTPFATFRIKPKIPSGVRETVLRRLHYEATRPSAKPIRRGSWHRIEGYPEIVALMRPKGLAVDTARWGDRVLGMDSDGNLFQMRNKWNLKDKHVPESLRSNGIRVERLKLLMRSRDVFEVLGNPQYEKPLSEKLGKE